MTRKLQWGSCHPDSDGHLMVMSSIGRLGKACREEAMQRREASSLHHGVSEDYLSELTAPSMRVEALTELLSAVIQRVVQIESQKSEQRQMLGLMEFAGHIQAAIWGLEETAVTLEQESEFGEGVGSIRWDAEVLASNLACVRKGLDDFNFK